MAVGFAVICEAPLRDKREDRYGQHTSARTAVIAMYKSNQITSNQIKPNQTKSNNQTNPRGAQEGALTGHMSPH